jgi:hypothetical protein
MTTYTSQQLQALKNAYSRGVLEVWEGETRVKFNTMSEMRAAIADIEAEISRGGPKPTGSRRITINKGY